MHEYDIALKSILRGCGGSVLAGIAGSPITQWHNVELPLVRGLRADLLGETEAGALIHIELQSSNDSEMVWRMLEYGAAIWRSFGSWPSQCVLYSGFEPLGMADKIRTPSLSYDCRMIDFREFDAEPLLSSPCLEDNIIAVLARLRDEREAVRRIPESIEASPPERRPSALQELMFPGGLRKLETVIEEETAKMPILNDIMDHDLFGPAIRRGRAEGERCVIEWQITERFGEVPVWARERLAGLSDPELKQMAIRLLKPCTLEELLG